MLDTKVVLAFVLGGALAGGVGLLVNWSGDEVAAADPQPAPAEEITPSTVVVEPVKEQRAVPAAEPAARPRPRSTKSATSAATSNPAPTAEPAPAPVEAKPAPEPDLVAQAPAALPEPRPAARTPEPVIEEPPAPPEPRTVTIPASTLLTVRLNEPVSSETHAAGDAFAATFDAPLVIDGLVIAERGERVEGRIADADRGGRVKGVAHLGLELTAIHTSDGQRLEVSTDTFAREAESSKKADAAKVGVGAGIGAALGAIFGGGKGAAIGAAAGGAAGAGTVAATRGDAAELPSETRLAFRMAEPVTVTERLQAGASSRTSERTWSRP